MLHNSDLWQVFLDGLKANKSFQALQPPAPDFLTRGQRNILYFPQCRFLSGGIVQIVLVLAIQNVGISFGIKKKIENSHFCVCLTTGVQDSNQEKVITVTGEGMLQSPDFPHTYPRSTTVVWRLVAPSNMRIQLTFDERFGLEDPEDGICK